MPENLSVYGPYFFCAVWLVLMAYCVYSTTLFDRCLSRIHDNNPALWGRLGCPRGYFWKPENGQTGYAQRNYYQSYESQKKLMWAVFPMPCRTMKRLAVNDPSTVEKVLRRLK